MDRALNRCSSKFRLNPRRRMFHRDHLDNRPCNDSTDLSLSHFISISLWMIEMKVFHDDLFETAPATSVRGQVRKWLASGTGAATLEFCKVIDAVHLLFFPVAYL